MSSISAGTTSTTTLVHSGDTTGSLVFKTNDTGSGGTTAVTLDTSQNATFAGKVTSAGALTLASNGTTTAVTIDTSQNVGIGGTPTQKLDVVGTARVANTTGNKYLLVGQSTPSANDGSSLEFQNSNSQKNWAIRSNWNIGGALEFCPSSAAGGTSYTTPSVAIDSSGNLFVGATTGTEKLKVDGGSGMSSSGVIARFFGTSSNSLLIRGNGNAENTNGSYGAISDVKLKENIVDATPKLADLMQVQVRNYNLKSDPTHKQLGVIAQELEQVFPAMIDESKDIDAEGNDLGTTTKSVKYSVFVPMLVKAIQELKAINDQQAETINALTARVVALEQK